ncbi:MAG TPA: PH domain-containing protein, partial [Nitrospira sp.]|nr:PH domain-containing protein [Nitrospira sp.]
GRRPSVAQFTIWVGLLYTSIPYSKIQTFSVETSGVLDRDCELEIYISAIGKIRFEIRGSFDIVAFNKVITGLLQICTDARDGV